MEHQRLTEVLARASARLAPHARARRDGGAHLDLHGHRHDPAIAEVALLAKHLQVVGRRVRLRRCGLGQALRAELQLQLGVEVALGQRLETALVRGRRVGLWLGVGIEG